MKAYINNIEVEGTVEEIKELLDLEEKPTFEVKEQPLKIERKRRGHYNKRRPTYTNKFVSVVKVHSDRGYSPKWIAKKLGVKSDAIKYILKSR